MDDRDSVENPLNIDVVNFKGSPDPLNFSELSFSDSLNRHTPTEFQCIIRLVTCHVSVITTMACRLGMDLAKKKSNYVVVIYLMWPLLC